MASGSLPQATQVFRFVRVATKSQAAALEVEASAEEVKKHVADESLEFDEPSFEPVAGVDIFADAPAVEEAK